MKYFNIEIATGKILSLNSCVQAVPDDVFVREAKEGEEALFYAGNLVYDEAADTLVKAPFTSSDELRQQMILEGTRKLNALAKQKGYLDLNDAISFANSNVASIKADAERAIELRDQLRVDIATVIAELSKGDIVISLEDAMKKITTPAW